MLRFFVRSMGVTMMFLASLFGHLTASAAQKHGKISLKLPTTHTVTPGQTIGAIAKLYKLDARDLAHLNRIHSLSVLLPAGQRIQLPKIAHGKDGHSLVMRPKHPGRLTFVRLATGERHQLQVASVKGRIHRASLGRIARIFRYGPNNLERAIDPRLVTNLVQVSDHFGGRPIEVISGFRPKMPKQYTPHSNHNIGRAVDMRIQGVPNSVLRDYCRTFKNAGVGFYPNSLFVHFDVRAQQAYWVDVSGPGEAPRYVDPSMPHPPRDAKQPPAKPDADVHDHHEHTLPDGPVLPSAPAKAEAPTSTGTKSPTVVESKTQPDTKGATQNGKPSPR